MGKDYSRDLTMVFAGSGETTLSNLSALLENFIFGPPPAPGEEEIEREVTIMIPAQYKNSPGVKTLLKWGTPMGMEFSVIPGDPHQSLDSALGMLSEANDAFQETAFIMFYNQDSKYEKDNPALTDLEVIGEAKNHEWLTTYNLSEGMVDYFDGYESTDERLKREALEEAFAEQQRIKEEAEKAARPPRKTAAKKATTPRKRAASTPKVEEDKPLPIEPEKPLAEPSCACGGQTLLEVHVPVGEGECHDRSMAKGWGPHEHKFVWGDDGMGNEGSVCACGAGEPGMSVGDSVEVGGLHFTKIADGPFPDPQKSGLDKLVADAVQREAERKTVRESTELSGTIVMGSSQLPDGLSPVATADVWQDVAKAVPADVESFQVSKADIVELGEAMEEMANAFSKAIRVYKNIVEGK